MSHKHVPEIRILKILEKNSDRRHPLHQKDIAAIYADTYGTDLGTKVLRRMLREIVATVDSVHCTEILQNCRRGGASSEMLSQTDFYSDHVFTDEELRFLIDAVTFVPHMPTALKKKMVEKLKTLSSNHFQPRHVLLAPEDVESNPDLLMNIGILDEAIRRRRKVQLKYFEYDLKRQLSIRKTKDGQERVHVINPYQFVLSNGKYYIVCNNDRFQTLAHYRIDRMTAMDILENSPRRELSELEFGASGVDLDLEMQHYCQQHVYMYSGRTMLIKLRIERKILSDLVDMFGSSVSFSQEDDGVIAVLQANPLTIRRFVKSYVPQVEVIAPEEFRAEMALDFQKAFEAHT